MVGSYWWAHYGAYHLQKIQNLLFFANQKGKLREETIQRGKLFKEESSLLRSSLHHSKLTNYRRGFKTIRRDLASGV